MNRSSLTPPTSEAKAKTKSVERVERGRTTTEVGLLDTSERVEEVARMLGGETVTDAARRHAREMVKQTRA